MRVVNIDIPEDHGYLIPIGDLHRGDRHFGKRGLAKVQGYIQWVLERPNAFIFLMGDILNVASRISATNPFESEGGDEEYQQAIDLFRPAKDRIKGVITGNHELRMSKMFGFNPLRPFCNELGLLFCNYSAAIRIRVGQRRGSSRYRQMYWGYAHHGTGGGATLGGALNRKLKLSEAVQGLDFVMAGHDHQLITGVREYFVPKERHMELIRTHYIDTGHFLDWEETYAEAMHMPMGKMGAARLRFEGKKDHHDMHVSL